MYKKFVNYPNKSRLMFASTITKQNNKSFIGTFIYIYETRPARLDQPESDTIG